MPKIYKYKLERTDEQTIPMPRGAKVYKVAMQNGDLCLWALVNEGADLIDATFRVIGTGHPIPDLDRLTFIETVFDEPFVWHVFGKT